MPNQLDEGLGPVGDGAVGSFDGLGDQPGSRLGIMEDSPRMPHAFGTGWSISDVDFDAVSLVGSPLSLKCEPKNWNPGSAGTQEKPLNAKPSFSASISELSAGFSYRCVYSLQRSSSSSTHFVYTGSTCRE